MQISKVLQEARSTNPAPWSMGMEDKIIYAINNVKRIRITYNDRKDNPKIPFSRQKGKKERYVLPVAFGLTKAGNKAFRAYQTAGSTKRGVPHWKMFLLKNCISMTSSNKSFKQYKDKLIELGLNIHGDKGMTTLYAITPIASDDVQVAKDTSQIPNGPMTKNDAVPSTKSQNPSAQSTNDTEPAKISREPAIDISPKNSYTTNNKLLAPDTKPISKDDIGNTQQNEPTEQPSVQEPQQSDGPITKQDIENSNSNDKNDLKSKFDDIMNRMDNLYKDEDENDKEEEK